MLKNFKNRVFELKIQTINIFGIFSIYKLNTGEIKIYHRTYYQNHSMRRGLGTW